MIAVGMVQAPVHQKIDVVTVWHRLVAAVLAVAVSRLVGGAIRGGAAVGVAIAYGDPVLVDVVFVGVVEVAVVQEIDVPLVPHGGVAAALFMLVVVAFVNLMIVHLSPLRSLSLPPEASALLTDRKRIEPYPAPRGGRMW